MAVVAPARLSVMQLRERLGRVGALSERQRTRLALDKCLPLALLLRAPYLSTPLGIDAGEIACIAHFCGHPIYLRNDRPAPPRPTASACPARAGDHPPGDDLVHGARPAPGRETGAIPR
jgi:hypothetical protein